MNDLKTPGGILYAQQAEEPGEIHLIANCVLAGKFRVNELDRNSAHLKPEDTVLVPASFSLVCDKCSNEVEESIYCIAQAKAAGWTEVSFTPECPDRNFSGICPHCSQESNPL